jgi:hypothetical protein
MTQPVTDDERERLQIAEAALRAISGNVPIVLLEYGVAILPDPLLSGS